MNRVFEHLKKAGFNIFSLQYWHVSIFACFNTFRFSIRSFQYSSVSILAHFIIRPIQYSRFQYSSVSIFTHFNTCRFIIWLISLFACFNILLVSILSVSIFFVSIFLRLHIRLISILAVSVFYHFNTGPVSYTHLTLPTKA